MNVVIQINGRDAIRRDAIPVRAIPFLTSWQKFSPDVLAAVLAQFDDAILGNGMRGLTAYRMGDDGVCAIPAYWWSSFVYRELSALSDNIRSRQDTQETGYQEWREQSIRILPAGVFVWRDEFEAGYARALDRWQRVAGSVLDSLVLNLRPDIPPKYSTSLILEGFNTQAPAPPPTSPASDPSWYLKDKKRHQGYSRPLYQALKEAHRLHSPRPTAHDVMAEFERTKPTEIAKVIAGESFDYYTAKGVVKTANIQALNEAIARMTR